MSDILVESFDKNVGASGDTLTLSNSVGATSKAFIRINNASDKASAGPTGSTANTNPNVGHVGAKLTAIDTITFYRNQSTQVKVIGEVWRYVGAAGGPNEFIVRGHYAVSISGASASQAVAGISNEDKCVPIITGVNTSEGARADYEQCSFAAHMDGSGNVVVSRNNSGTSATVYVTVVEFTGSNWSVGHGKSASHDGSTETVTLNDDSDGVSGSTFDVSDWETAFIEASMEGDSAETGLADVMALCYPHADTDKVYFTVNGKDANARNDGVGWIHVVKNADLIVKRAWNSNIAEGNGTYGTATWPTGASTSRDLDQLALEWYVTTTGTGTAHLRARLGARVTAASGTIQHWVHRSGNAVGVRYGVIDLSQLVSAASVPLSGQSDGEATVSGAITAKRGLSGASDGSGDASGAIQAKRGVSGSTEGSAEIGGTLKAKRSISGQTDGEAGVSGSLGAKRHLSGESAGAATVTGQLASDKAVGTFLHPRTRSLVKPISGRWSYFFLRNKLRQEIGDDLYV